MTVSIRPAAPTSHLPANDQFQTLRSRLAGQIILPAHPDYDTARKTLNINLDRRPAAIVRVANTQDVAETVRFARERGLPLAVRSGGHSLAQYSVINDAVIVDFSSMKRVSIDPETRIAHVQPGATSGDLAGPANALGLALTIGASAVYGESGDLEALKKRLSALEAKTAKLEAENKKLLESPVTRVETTSADKIKLFGPVKELSLYGDLGLRYQWDNSQNVYYNHRGHLGRDHGEQRSRFRYRLRLSADFKLSDNWFGGVQLATNQFPDSGFQTYNRGFANQEIYLSKAFIGWKATDWATIIAGKQNNPFYSTELVWDRQLNPSGVVERIAFHKLFEGSLQEEITGYSKDGKPISSSRTTKVTTPWELTLVAGQFFFDDNNEWLDGYRNNRDAYLFVEQLIGTYKFNKDLSVTVAPAFLTYNGANANPVNVHPFPGSSYSNPEYPYIGSTAYLRFIDVPGDITFKVFNKKVKAYWDFTYNFDGKQRAEKVYLLNGEPLYLNEDGKVTTEPAKNTVTVLKGARHSSKDNFAYLVGLQVGENKRKHDWSAFVNYRQVGLAAVDPNLNEGTWGGSRTNLKGWKAGIAYNFTDSVVGSVTYYYADALRKNLYGAQVTEGSKIANYRKNEIIQVDLNVKF